MKHSACPSFATATMTAALATATIFQAQALPTISSAGQPKDYSVSLGSMLTNRVQASSLTPPTTYQWSLNNTPIPGATTALLVIQDVQSIHAGNYIAVVTDSTGSVTSRVARLEVDPTFVKVVTGPLVTNLNSAETPSWADFDNDGDLDVVVPGFGPGQTAYYRNEGGGIFTRLEDKRALPFLTVPNGYAAPCGDFNNDGYMDFVLYTLDPQRPDDLLRGNRLYTNNGDATFSESPPFEPSLTWSAAVFDFDLDGNLDLFLGLDADSVPMLLRGDGKGGFLKQTADMVGPLLDPGWFPRGMAFADYDDDGQLDVFAPYSGSSPKTNLLFRGVGGGRFERVIGSAVRHTGVRPIAGAWGDINNDGRLDLLVANHRTPDGIDRSLGIYVNLGDGKFEDVTTTALADNPPSYKGFVTLMDYDNDGHLDAFATGIHPNVLLHNNGDGSFTRIESGSVVNDPFHGGVTTWLDYDGDGFLDHHAPNVRTSTGEPVSLLPGYLYRGSGNANHWLKVKVVGTTSNRMGAGAKIRVQTVIGGLATWQRRDISGGDAWNGNHLDAHFGLGNATEVTMVRVQWPSGIVQELAGIATDQNLTIVEPAFIRLTCRSAPSGILVQCHGLANASYELQVSANLKVWTVVQTLTSPTGTSLTSLGMEQKAQQNRSISDFVGLQIYRTGGAAKSDESPSFCN